MTEEERKIKFRSEKDGRVGRMYCKCGEVFLTDSETSIGKIYDWGLIHRVRGVRGHRPISREEWLKKNGNKES